MTEDDFAFDSVPEEKTISALRIAVVIIGIVIALPSFITGSKIGFMVGFDDGVKTIAAGGAILAVIAMATGIVGARTRLNTAMIIKLTFGQSGGRLVSGVLAIACLGWFGVTAELFGHSIRQLILDQGSGAYPASVYTLLGGLLMVITTMVGFTALRWLSNITLPLLVVLMVYTLHMTLHKGTSTLLAESVATRGSLGDGISAVVGGWSVGVTIFPDLARFSRSTGGACMAAILTYALAMPAILIAAMIPSLIVRSDDLIGIMTALGLGLPAIALVATKAWATNAGNLYFASLGAANLTGDRSRARIVIIAGLVGTMLAVLGLTQKLIVFLVALGVSIPPIAGIYVVEFWRRGGLTVEQLEGAPAVCGSAFLGWTLGIVVALLGRDGMLALSGIPSIDAMAVAGASYFLLSRFRHNLRFASKDG